MRAARKQAESTKHARWCLGDAYQPHIRVQDISSTGRKTRIKYQRREVHLLSDLEVQAFRHFQWEPSVFGIEEQYYLEVEDTVRIAADAGIDHPVDVKTKAPFEMSTDLVVYYRANDGGERRIARSVKRSEDIEETLALPQRKKKIKRTIEKLEIERRYWTERGVDWAILTQLELSEPRTRTIEMLLKSELDCSRPDGFWQEVANRIHEALFEGEGFRIVDLQRQLDGSGVVDAADFASCFRHLCATRQLTFDMKRRYDLLRPVSDFTISQVDGDR
jgi:hypothetical protein